METKTPTKLERLIPSKELIVHSTNGLETVYDTNAYLRDSIKNLFLEIILEAIEESEGFDASSILDRLRIKTGEL